MMQPEHNKERYQEKIMNVLRQAGFEGMRKISDALQGIYIYIVHFPTYSA